MLVAVNGGHVPGQVVVAVPGSHLVQGHHGRASSEGRIDPLSRWRRLDSDKPGLSSCRSWRARGRGPSHALHRPAKGGDPDRSPKGNSDVVRRARAAVGRRIHAERDPGHAAQRGEGAAAGGKVFRSSHTPRPARVPDRDSWIAARNRRGCAGRSVGRTLTWVSGGCSQCSYRRPGFASTRPTVTGTTISPAGLLPTSRPPSSFACTDPPKVQTLQVDQTSCILEAGRSGAARLRGRVIWHERLRLARHCVGRPRTNAMVKLGMERVVRIDRVVTHDERAGTRSWSSEGQTRRAGQGCSGNLGSLRGCLLCLLLPSRSFTPPHPPSRQSWWTLLSMTCTEQRMARPLERRSNRCSRPISASATTSG